jgi:hypothetical protein
MAGRTTIYPGLGERIVAAIHAIMPSVIDSALIRKAHTPRAQAALTIFNEQKEA